MTNIVHLNPRASASKKLALGFFDVAAAHDAGEMEALNAALNFMGAVYGSIVDDRPQHAVEVRRGIEKGVRACLDSYAIRGRRARRSVELRTMVADLHSDRARQTAALAGCTGCGVPRL